MPPWIDYCSLRLRVKGKSPNSDNRVWCYKGKRTVWGVEGTVGGNLTKFTGHLNASKFHLSHTQHWASITKTSKKAKETTRGWWLSLPVCISWLQCHRDHKKPGALQPHCKLQVINRLLSSNRNKECGSCLWLLTRYFRIEFRQMHWIILVTHPCPLMLKLKQPSLSHPSESAPH